MAATEQAGSGRPYGGQRGDTVVLGVVLVVGAVIALSAMGAVAPAATILVALALLVAAGGHLWHAGRAREREPVGHHVLLGLLALFSGLAALVFLGPEPVSLTLVVAVFLVFGGAIRISSAVRLRFRGWGLVVVSGLFGMAFGGVVMLQWAYATVWVLGLLVGLDLLFAGAMWIAIGFSRRGARREARANP
jgi:uncharacterized membrane protein HdeD (DUF308 family)